MNSNDMKINHAKIIVPNSRLPFHPARLCLYIFFCNSLVCGFRRKFWGTCWCAWYEFRGTVTEAAKEWILGTPSDKLFEEYNHATLDTENLKAVRDTFKLTVYSIMCRAAMKLNDHSDDCPLLWNDRAGIGKTVLTQVYEKLSLIFPDSKRRIDLILKALAPPQQVSVSTPPRQVSASTPASTPPETPPRRPWFFFK